MKYKILCTDGFSQTGLDELAKSDCLDITYEKALSHEELLGMIGDYDGLIVRSASTVSRDVIDAGTKLKIVARAGVGTDNIDIPAATERGILIVNAPAGNTLSTAELAFSLLLSLSRHIPQSAAAMADGRWEKKRFKGNEVAFKTLGVIGLGRIGCEVAKRGQAFKMRVIGYDPFLGDDRIEALGVESKSVADLLKEADYVTIHTPLTDETRDLISAEQIAMMKPTARIVNCARGGIVNEEDLAAALRDGVIAGAALDVYTSEPYTKPTFKGLENVVLTPHLGASTFEAQDAVAREASATVSQFFADGISFNAVNLPGANPQDLSEFRHHMLLAEKVGSFASQLSSGEVSSITFRSTTRTTKLVALSAVRGVLSNIVGEDVTFVNAAAVASGRGISIVEETISSEKDMGDAIAVRLGTPGGDVEIWGQMLSDGLSKIIRLDSCHVDIDPYGTLLVIENVDKPGVIGRICTILGEYGVNIAEMQNVRKQGKHDALTIIGVDEVLPDEAMDAIRSDDSITSARVVRL
jgi:D-3-phosphoglycerate dehydrogenase / 2-oxoglutarate reductase